MLNLFLLSSLIKSELNNSKDLKSIISVTRLKKKTQRYTILKAPSIYKSARNQLAEYTYSAEIKIQVTADSELALCAWVLWFKNLINKSMDTSTANIFAQVCVGG